MVGEYGVCFFWASFFYVRTFFALILERRCIYESYYVWNELLCCNLAFFLNKKTCHCILLISVLLEFPPLVN